jgi:hypothetical protein
MQLSQQNPLLLIMYADKIEYKNKNSGRDNEKSHNKHHIYGERLNTSSLTLSRRPPLITLFNIIGRFKMEKFGKK